MAVAKQEFDKVIPIKTVAGTRNTRVIVLRESDDALVYIPMNAIDRVDYTRLKKIHQTSEIDLLTSLRDDRLDHGRNALVTYADVIRTYNKLESVDKQGTDVKPVEPQTDKPTRRKPGPKPGSTRRKPGPKPKAPVQDEE